MLSAFNVASIWQAERVDSKLRWIIVGACLTLVLAAAIWPGRRAYRHFREAHTASQAVAFLEAKDYANASLSARRALAYNPNSVEACGVMAALAEAAGLPVVLEWRRRIAEIEPTLTNTLRLAAASLRHQPPPYALARQLLADLPPAATNAVPFHLVSAELALKLSQFGDAERHILAASALAPDNALHQLNLAVLRLQSTNLAVATEARAVLGRLRTDPAVGPDALRSLVSDHARRGERTAAMECSTQLLADARATLLDRLQHLSLLHKDGSPGLGASLTALKAQAVTNAPAIHQLTAWMIGHAQAEDALGWLQQLPEPIRSSQPVAMAMTDCYVALEEWTAMEAFLENQQWEDQDFLRLALRSRAAGHQGQSLAATAHWRDAIRSAGDRLGALALLLQLADRWDRPRELEELLWRMAERFPAQQWTLRELNRRYAARGDTHGQHRVYAAMLALRPTDLVLKNNFAATALLLKVNLSRAYPLAQEVYEADKSNAVFVSTHAFALHLQGKTGEGLKLMQSLPAEKLQQPSIAAYYALLLAAAGEGDKARPYFAAAEKGSLLPEERELLQRARGSNSPGASN
ncbi:MAG: hypothetical protein IH623_07040 [Verrucomicrobia bacterium]|nr:hypothetical protein [Verrucomicrobiota bacterium]